MHQGHDHSYKLLFSEPEVVIDLLQGFVHEDWVDKLDFNTLEKVSGSYISDDLRAREDDIIWKVKYDDSWVYIYLLLEFQSTIDKFMAVRLMSYIGLLYQDLIKTSQISAKQRLPPVFPVVLYNGDQRWNAATELQDLIVHVPGGLSKYLPSLKYLLLDEGAYKLEELSPLKNLVAAIFRLENVNSQEEIIDVVSNLIEWLNSPDQISIRRSFSIWINRVLQVPKGNNGTPTHTNSLLEIKAMLKQSIPLWIEEGVAKGVARGEVIGEARGEANTLLKLLTLKFNPLPDWVEEKIHTAEKAQLDIWVERVLSAELIEDLFK